METLAPGTPSNTTASAPFSSWLCLTSFCVNEKDPKEVHLARSVGHRRAWLGTALCSFLQGTDVSLLCLGPAVLDPSNSAFFGAHIHTNNTAELSAMGAALCLLENFFKFSDNACITMFYDSLEFTFHVQFGAPTRSREWPSTSSATAVQPRLCRTFPVFCWSVRCQFCQIDVLSWLY